jgi:hypothetical protein
MRFLDSAELAGIQKRTVAARDLVWITARPIGGGDPVDYGFSTLVRNVDIEVRSGRTGAVVSRPYRGVGGAFKLGSIALTSDITVRSVDIDLPAIDATVADMLRGHDMRNAPVEIHRAYYDPDTRLQLAPAKPRFVGTVDGAPIETPVAGSAGRARITCVSTTRELTRANPDVRSHQSQLARSGGTDDFYMHTAVVADWQIFWGQAQAGTPAVDVKGGPSKVGGP